MTASFVTLLAFMLNSQAADIDFARNDYAKTAIAAAVRLPDVRTVVPDENLPQTMIAGETGMHCRDDHISSAYRAPGEALHVGPVTDISDGHFNLLNPACLQYPEANGCALGERIGLSDFQNLRAFARGGHVTWKLSPLQRFSDAVSLLTLAAALLSLAPWAWANPPARPSPPAVPKRSRRKTTGGRSRSRR